MERKAFQFDVKAFAEDANDGTFEGYLSVFDVVDYGNDSVKSGAFAKTLQANPTPPILFNHDDNRVIGVFRSMVEDEKGLFVKGELNLETQDGRETYALLRQGALKGLSIGYGVDTFSMTKSGVRQLEALTLWEGSLTAFPMCAPAQVTSVKSAIEDDIRILKEAVARLESAQQADSQPQPQTKKGLSADDALKITETFRELTTKWNK